MFERVNKYEQFKTLNNNDNQGCSSANNWFINLKSNKNARKKSTQIDSWDLELVKNLEAISISGKINMLIVASIKLINLPT